MFCQTSIDACARCLAVCGLVALASVVSQQAFGANPSVDADGFVLVQAEDRNLCTVDGSVQTHLYPRSVDRKIALLLPGSRLTATTDLGNISVIFPPVFDTPGPRYGDFLPFRLRVRVDAQPWRELALAAARAETIVAENLPPGKHTITVEPVGGLAAVDAFRFTKQPMAGFLGTVTSGDYSELLTDVRMELYQGDRRVRTEYVRQPRSGGFEIYGMAAGEYRLRVSAAGWKDQTLADLKIQGAGDRVDVGTIVLVRDPRCGGSEAQDRPGPRFGHSACVTPGSTFTALVSLPATSIKKAQLQSRFKSIDLTVKDYHKIPIGRWNDAGEATFRLPKEVPWDMYDLVLSSETEQGPVTQVSGQAVCVRESLPEEFHVAGCGHMNTWGQQTAEYLARVAEVAELAGARTFLVANEVNAAYVSGALADLRIPYVVARGNHTMGRWDDFYGPTSRAHDDGPMRIVNFGLWPYESWQEMEALFHGRPQATIRVAVCYEGYVPHALVREQKLSLLFDGHSDNDEPARKPLPPRAFWMRAPTQESLRWIPMTHAGVAPAVKSNADVPLLNIPRTGPAPLRATFEQLNDGSAAEQTATITNEFATEFPRARLRLVLRRGAYRIDGAKLLQSFDSDDAARTILDVEAHVAAKGILVVRAVAK